jgi:hypothetical protein
MALTLTLALAAYPASTASAQQWSAEQMEVVDAMKHCWNVWMEAVNSGSPTAFQAECQTEDSSFWVGTQSAPIIDKGYLDRTWGVEAGMDLAWLDLRPLHISIHGDVAVIHFYGLWRFPGPVVAEWKRTEVWRKEGGTWRQWTGHVTPVSP